MERILSARMFVWRPAPSSSTSNFLGAPLRSTEYILWFLAVSRRRARVYSFYYCFNFIATTAFFWWSRCCEWSRQLGQLGYCQVSRREVSLQFLPVASDAFIITSVLLSCYLCQLGIRVWEYVNIFFFKIWSMNRFHDFCQFEYLILQRMFAAIIVGLFWS